MVVPTGIPAPLMVAPTNKLVGLFGQLGGLVNVKILLPLAVEAEGLKLAVVCIDANEPGLFTMLKYWPLSVKFTGLVPEPSVLVPQLNGLVTSPFEML